MYFRGYRAKKLTNSQFNELRARLENAFTIRRKRIDDNKTYYELDGSINRMSWLDSGTIELRKTDEIVTIKFAVSSVVQLFFLLMVHISAFGYTYLSSEDAGLGLWATLLSCILYPLLFILTYIGFKLMELRISNIIQLTVAPKDYELSKEQQQWVNDPDRCPACGEHNVGSKAVCPDCGLTLR